MGGGTGPHDPGGVVFGQWDIVFNNGTFQRSYSDVGEGGTYEISGEGLVLEDSRSHDLKVFINQDVIEFDGHRYGLEKDIGFDGPDGVEGDNGFNS